MSRNIRLRVNSLEERFTPTAGQLDPSFGAGGLVTTRFPSASDDYGRSTAIDSLGRIVVAGYSNNGSNNDFAITRYTAAGALDTSFGGTGIVTIAFGPSDDEAYGIAIDSLDRIVVAGSTKNGSKYDTAVARLTTAGALDTSFDGDGKQTIDLDLYEEVYSVAVDSLDRIVIAGSTYFDYYFAVARLTSSGGLDSSFEVDGKQFIYFGWYVLNTYSVAVDSLNRIVVAGSAALDLYPDVGTTDFAVARLTSTGALDTSFDLDGTKIIAFGADNDSAYGVAVDSLDRVVVAGFAANGYDSDFAVARLTVAGDLDTSFDADGKQTIDFGFTEKAYAVAIDSLDRVVVAGTDNFESDFEVARLTSAGALDTTFDADGKQTIALGPANGVAVDSMDRILVAGYTFTPIATRYDFALARFTVNGILDTSLDADGKQATDLAAGSTAYGRAVAIDSLGRTVVAGYANSDFAVTRYTAAGALDLSFGGTGSVTIDFGAYDLGYGVAVDSLDRVVVAGGIYNGTNYSSAVARLTSNGALDTNFDGDGKLIIDFGQNDNWVWSVAVDSLDRIVVAGYVANSGSNYDFALTRLTTAGALDASFDTDGKQTIAFSPSFDVAYSVAIDSIDRVVVAGYAYDGLALARLTPAGVLDTSFDVDGKETINLGAGFNIANDVAIDSLDRVVVVAGSAGSYPNYVVALARFTSAGVLDTTFDADGKLTVDFGAPYNAANSVAIDSLDRIVFGGWTGNYMNYDFAVARLTQTGVLDTSFDADGKQFINFGSNRDEAYAVTIDSLGRIIVAGHSEMNGHAFSVTRLTGDASPSMLASIIVNNDVAQRSIVTSLTVAFDSKVSFGGVAASAFQLNRQSDNAAVTLAAAVDASGTIVTLTFTGGAVDPGGSLADGRYTLKILANQFGGLGFDGNDNGLANGSPADDYTLIGTPANGLFRLFGDSDGNGAVNSDDFAGFRDLFGMGPSFFDFNNDGLTNSADFIEFRKRFGLMI